MNLRYSIVAVPASAAVRAWATLLNSWHAMMGTRAGIYRPEAHYMRGPGPKWREKHAQIGNIAAR